LTYSRAHQKIKETHKKLFTKTREKREKIETIDILSWAALVDNVTQRTKEESTVMTIEEAEEMNASAQDNLVYFNQAIKNEKEVEVSISLLDTQFIIPKKSTFIMVIPIFFLCSSLIFYSSQICRN